MVQKFKKINWFEIYVNDMQRAKKFYETIFELELERIDPPKSEMEMFTFGDDMNGYGANGAIVQMQGVSAGNNSTIVYFGCEDCAHEENKVESAGGKVIHKKFSIGEHGFISIVQDTEGNMIGLHSLK